MTNEQIRTWCVEGGIVFDHWNQIGFENGLSIRIPFPKQVFAAPLLLLEMIEDLKVRTCSHSVLLWIWDTGIWDLRLDDIGLPQLNILNLAFGTSANDAAPGYLFEENENKLCVGTAVLPMLYSWDAYLIPDSRKCFIYISHDEFLGICYKEESEESAIMAHYHELDPTAHRTLP